MLPDEYKAAVGSYLDLLLSQTDIVFKFIHCTDIVGKLFLDRMEVG